MSATPMDDALRAQLEAEHQENLERFQTRKQQHRQRRRRKAELVHERKVQVDEQAARAAFFKGKGYKRYVDSRGREQWLLPEEYEWRMRAKKARRKRQKKYGNPNPGQRTWLIWLGMVGIGLVVGIALVLK